MASPAMKRIMQEAKELRKPTDQYHAAPLEENIFEWHFTIAGPAGTDFAGGIYHGRIILPPEYPMKPPNFSFLTENGRFEIGKKICLSISAHHPESWQPSWSIRTMLLAVIAFMPTPGEGAIGALDYTQLERQKLAQRSVNSECSKCGKLRDRLAKVGTQQAKLSDAEQKALEEMKKIGFSAPRTRTTSEIPATSAAGDDAASTPPPCSDGPASRAVSRTPDGARGAPETRERVAGRPRTVSEFVPSASAATAPATVTTPPAAVARQGPVSGASTVTQGVAPAREAAPAGWSLQMLLFGVVLAIAALLYRKYTRAGQLGGER
eukprot:m.126214 g.126214  ORF g.126214 m.126214 type:complete len:322 (-) comp17361_c0_seq1:52-1017(-)